MPPQIRNRPYTEPQQLQQLQQTLAPRTASNAEADLLGKLQVSPPSPHQFTVSAPSAAESIQRATIASQAERQLLSQLHASTAPAVATVPQQKIATAQSAEDTLLKSLQTPASTVTTITGPAQATPSSTYSFSPTSYGTIQVFQNGKLIGTGTASYAQQYGYQASITSPSRTLTPLAPASPSQAPQLASVKSAALPITAAAPNASSSPYQGSPVGVSIDKPISASAPAASATASTPVPTTTFAATNATEQPAPGTALKMGTALTSFYQSNPVGSTVVDTLASAGGAVAKVPGLTALGNVDEAISLTTLIQQKNYAEIPANLTSFAGSTLAGDAPAAFLAAAPIYAAPLAAGTFALSFDVGQHTVAPIAGPWLGNQMFNLNPNFWTPASNPNITNIPTTVWTGQAPQTQQGGVFSLPGP